MPGRTRFSPAELRVPLVQAPMAGGGSTPSLAAACAKAGALGFLAGGYLTAEVLASHIADTRRSVSAPFGVNLFVPQPPAEPDRLAAYRAELAETEAIRYGIELPEPKLANDDAWPEKVELLLDDPVSVVSFTFGLPEAATVTRFQQQGTYTIGTVTSAEEARQAAAVGVDAICVQGPEAGGHRGVFDPAAAPSTAPLLDLLAEVRAAVGASGPPLIAAGGLATARDAARLRAAGAVLTQHGTAFLRAEEAGTAELYREALVDPRFAETVVTRAFSGRWVRTLRNRFTDQHADAPAVYPAINELTRPLRAAAAENGDPDGMGLYAGVRHSLARAEPAARIIDSLAAHA
ncbi:MAG TPA: nitronate monooxygenase [Actinospica sp.]|jgi:nitronate monooxygenase|nr:nitronate monooxygenase [Actinospica sp.]